MSASVRDQLRTPCNKAQEQSATRLTALILQQLPTVSIEVSYFDSGAYVVDVRQGEAMYVIEVYSETQLVVFDASLIEPFTPGQGTPCESMESAVEKLIELMPG